MQFDCNCTRLLIRTITLTLPDFLFSGFSPCCSPVETLNLHLKTKNVNKSIVQASYRVSHIIGKEVHSFSHGEFVKKCIIAVVEELCPENKSVFESVSLSRMTTTRRVEDLGSDLKEQLKSKAGHFECFPLPQMNPQT